MARLSLPRMLSYLSQRSPQFFVRRKTVAAGLVVMAVVTGLVLTRGRRFEGWKSRKANEATAKRLAGQDAYRALPLSFEPNQGQTDPHVSYVARGAGYNLFLTPNEAVLTLSTASIPREDDAVSDNRHPANRSQGFQTPAQRRSVLRMSLFGANPEAPSSLHGELAGKTNYFIGNDPNKWQRGVPSFSRVDFREIYDGIDLTYYGNQRQLEYDFRVQPGGDPRRIVMSFDGAEQVRIDESGDLVLHLDGREVRQQKPFSYQEVDGVRRVIPSRYSLISQTQVGFEVGEYDLHKQLVIDPVLVYSTYFGGSGFDTANGIAVNSNGEAYITGTTASLNFPASPVQKTALDVSDAFVVKLNAAGTAVVYASYFGGDNHDYGNAIALDANGNAYVTGQTHSYNFPTAGSPYQSSKTGGNPLFKSTDSGVSFGVGVAGDNTTGLTTASISSIAVHPTNPSIVFATPFFGAAVYKSVDGGATWAPSGNGIAEDFINDIAFNRADPTVMYVAATNSSLAPSAGGLYRSVNSGANWTLIPGPTSLNTLTSDAAGTIYVGGFDGKGLWKSADGTTWSSSVVGDLEADGGTDGFGFAISNIAVDPSNLQTIYVGTSGGGIWKSLDGGTTWSQVLNAPGYVSDHSLSIDPSNTQTLYAVLNGQLQKTTNAGSSWTVVSTSVSAGSYPTSTLVSNATVYLGTTQNGVLKSTDGGANWTNTSLTSNAIHGLVAAPSATNEIYAEVLSGADGFVTKFSPDGGSLSYSTYLGGGVAGSQFNADDNLLAIAVDNSGNAYVTGATAAANFPTLGAVQTTSAGFNDAVVAKLNSSGSSVLFSSYLGGNSNEAGRGIAVSASGSIYVAGNTTSSNFPIANAAQPVFAGGNDSFTTKLDSAGGSYSIGFSTFLGGAGNDQARAVAVDGSGNAYVSGQTNTGGLATTGAAQTTKGLQFDGFVAKYTALGVKSYFTYVGGTGTAGGEFSRDIATGVAVDSSGNAYVTGYTRSGGFPVSGSLKTFNATVCDGVPCYDAFVMKINAAGSARIFSTLLGGDGSDQSLGIAVDNSGNAYVAGLTTSIEAKPGAVQAANGGGSDAFITKIVSTTDLSVSMTDSPDPVSVNSTLTYTITATNSGEGNLTSVAVSDSLPANVTLVSATVSQGSCTGTTTVNCNLGSINAGQSATVTIQVTPSQEGTLSNTAAATCSEAEANSSNNSATQSTRVTVGTVYTVNSNADTDDSACTASGTGNGCTLREALNAANGNAQKDTILFSIGSGLQTITLTSSLPNLTQPVSIDATSQPGFAGQPIIEINGASANSCFYVSSSGNTLRGFVINRCGGHGIQLDGNNNVIQGNYIGTNASGTATLPVTYSSIIIGGSNNQIGGTTASARNVLSGNGHQGIALGGSGNTIQGNYIGTNAAGTAALGGGSVFVFQGASNNLIGGTAGTTPGGACAGACNLISGNGGSLNINTYNGAGATNNTVQGNFIGLNASGTGAVPNNGSGVILSGVSGNHIIGNVISGNNGTGISLIESDPNAPAGSNNNDIRGNFIGTNSAGTAAMPNGGGGIDLHGGASGNTIGGSSAADRNVISGNNNSGITIGTFYGNASGNFVYGNYIGTDVTGNVRLANTGNGISLMGVTSNRIGGTQAGQGNLISGNNNQGVRIDMGTPGPNLAAVPSDGNFVQGNLIGTNLAGTASLKNNNGGVSINGSHNNLIGGVVSGARNVISGNGQNGVTITNSAIIGSSSNNNKVQGNYIGTDITGTVRLQNDSQGVGIYAGSTGNMIGGDDAADGATDGVVNARNIISGNNGDGVNMGNFAGAATANTVAGNYIGTNKLGTAAVANTGQGIGIYGTVNITIGGITPGAGNLISGNNNSGIVIGSASPGSGQPQVGSTGAQVLGNFIGTNATGTAVIRNTFAGVSVTGGSSNIHIGGTIAGARNLISGNGGNGVDFGGNSNGNFCEGNYVGTDVTGMSALVTTVSGVPFYGNGSGVGINGASNNKIGGTTTAERNVISGNNCQGVPIYNSLVSGVVVQASNNIVQGNYIGLNKDGTGLVTDPNGGAPFGNKCSGVFLGGSTNNLIGGTAPGAGNVIGGSAHQGIVISDNNNVVGSGNIIRGNTIGSNVALTAALPNGIGIFLINGASNNTIGGDDDDDGTPDGVVKAGNMIFGSTGDGLQIQSSVSAGVTRIATGNIVQGNLIGGSTLLRNGNNGVNLNGARNNTIGGATPGAGNTISFNNNNGVVVNCPVLNGVVTCGLGNAVQQNSIFSNNNIGIRFNSNGASVGHNNQASPIVTFVSTTAGGTTAQGTLTSVSNSQFTLDFYSNDACDPTGAGEGQTYIGSTQVTTDGGGLANFSAASLAAVPTGKIVTATATHATNGTSRFSACTIASNATATISGRTTDQNGVAIGGATITLTGGQNALATTDAQGGYSFSNLPSSVSYTVTAAFSGVTFYPASFTLANLPADRTVNFTVAVARYTITDLGALTAGPQSVGWDVNNAGQATGWSNSGATNTNYQPYFYNNGTLTNLAPMGSGTNALAISINDNARVVGYSELAPQAAGGAFTGQIHGFFSDNGGVLKDIGTFGGASSQAWGVNDNGVVVGQAQNSSNQSRPFVWRDLNNDGLWQLSETIDVGWINGGTNGRLFAINNNNVAVGNNIDGATGFQTATLWKDDNANGISDLGDLRLLGTLGGPTSIAQGINDNGYVSGYSDINGLASNGRTMHRAFIWHDDNGNGVSDAGEMKNLGTLGGEFSLAIRINASNEIVGWSDAVGINTPRAMRWKNNFMLDLNAAIPQNSGWTLVEARGLSDNGKITGYGTINGVTHAYLLTPSVIAQTVTFDPIANKTYGNASFTVTATASSGLPVTFSVVSGPATVSGNTVTITGAGSVTLRATQSGDATYDSATADQTFTVSPALLRVIADSKTKVFGAPNPAFTVRYSGFVNGDTASSLGGAVTFSAPPDNSPVGTYSITPSGLSSTNYTFQYLAATLTIDQASTSTFSGNYSLPVPGSVNLLAQVNGDAPSTLPVSGGTVTFVIRQGATTIGTVTSGAVSNGQAGASFNVPAGGAYTVYASYSGSSNYLGSTGVASLTVGNANPIPSITGVAPDSAVKKSTETGQFTLLIDGNGFMSTGNGDPGNSSVDWYDRTTGAHTNLTITSTTASQIQAVVPYTLIRDGKTVEVTVINPGPGGGASNVQPFFVTDTTATVTAADTVLPDPTTGTASSTSVTPTGATLSAEASSGGSGGTGTLTVAQYSGDPIGTNSSPNTSAFSTAEGSGYFDVYVSPGSSFTSLTLDYCNTGGTTLYWWNGSVWGLVSNQTYNPTTGCITVTVTTTSSPSIAQLTGTVFGVGGGPAINSITVTPSATVALGTAITLNASIIDATGGGPYTVEINWGDGQTTLLNDVAGPNLSSPHTYAAANSYGIAVKVSRGTSFGSATFSPMVVFDRSAGAMNTDGWISAPLGSYSPNPAFVSRIFFQANARYDGSATVPAGTLTINLPGRNFRATNFSSLVINGSNLQLRGAGTIDSAGSYGFLLTGFDGKLGSQKLPDKVRLKLWDLITGSVVFDSQMDGAENALPTIVLGGGSVNIKK